MIYDLILALPFVVAVFPKNMWLSILLFILPAAVSEVYSVLPVGVPSLALWVSLFSVRYFFKIFDSESPLNMVVALLTGTVVYAVSYGIFYYIFMGPGVVELFPRLVVSFSRVSVFVAILMSAVVGLRYSMNKVIYAFSKE